MQKELNKTYSKSLFSRSLLLITLTWLLAGCPSPFDQQDPFNNPSKTAQSEQHHEDHEQNHETNTSTTGSNLQENQTSILANQIQDLPERITPELINQLSDFNNPASAKLFKQLQAITDPRSLYNGQLASEQSYLRGAIEKNDTDKIKIYLTQRNANLQVFQLNFVDEYEDIANPYKDYGQGNTALHLAINQGNWETACTLLEYAVDNEERKVNIANHQGQTALHCAAQSGQVAQLIHLLQILCNHGISLDDKIYIDINAVDNHGRTCLDLLNPKQRKIVNKFILASTSQVKCLHQLLPSITASIIANVPAKNFTQASPLPPAFAKNLIHEPYVEAVKDTNKYFTKTQIDFSKKLYEAVKHNQPWEIEGCLSARKKLLTEHQSVHNPYWFIRDIYTVFHKAAKISDLTMNALLQYAVHNDERKLNIRGRKDATPLHEAAAKCNQKVIYTMLARLVEAGINIYEPTEHIHLGAKDFNGETAVDYATRKGYQKVIQLIKYPFHSAIEACTSEEKLLPNNKALYQGLVEKGYAMEYINQQDDEGNTPLHIAARNNHIEAVKYLLQQPHIDLTIKNNQGMTALHEAALYYQHEEIILSFLNKGARLAPIDPMSLGRAIAATMTKKGTQK